MELERPYPDEDRPLAIASDRMLLSQERGTGIAAAGCLPDAF
jgi:hypothetical protein